MLNIQICPLKEAVCFQQRSEGRTSKKPGDCYTSNFSAFAILISPRQAVITTVKLLIACMDNSGSTHVSPLQKCARLPFVLEVFNYHVTRDYEPTLQECRDMEIDSQKETISKCRVRTQAWLTVCDTFDLWRLVLIDQYFLKWGGEQILPMSVEILCCIIP